MQDLTLSRVLGECLAGADGLTFVHVPDGIDIESAIEIVDSANEVRPAVPSYAILVTDSVEKPHGVTCPWVSTQGTIQYRQEDHLAVVYGRQPDLASFVHAFRPVLGQSYPIDAEGAASLSRVAEFAIRILQQSLGQAGNNIQGMQDAASQLAQCLRVLAEAHQALAGGGRNWNTTWFEHVSIGLATLHAKVVELTQKRPETTLAEVVARYTFASFGLPTPSAKGTKFTGKAIAKAVEANWSSEDSMKAAAKQVSTRYESEHGIAHPIQDVDFNGIDAQAAAADSLLLAIGKRVGEDPDNVEAFSRLTESQFLQPAGAGNQDSAFDITADDGSRLTLEQFAIRGPYFVSMELSADGTLRSDLVRIVIPMLGTATPADVEASRLRFQISPGKTSWTGHLELDEEGRLIAVGTFEMPLPASKASLPLRPLRLTLTVPSTDPLAGLVVGTATCEIYLFPRMATFAAYAPKSAKGKIGKFKCLGPSNLLDGLPGATGSADHVVEIDSDLNRLQLIVWHPDATQQVSLDGVELSEDGLLPGFRVLDMVPTGINMIAAGHNTFTLRSAEPKKGHQSALLAAAGKQHVTPVEPAVDTKLSLRGQIEIFLKEEVESAAVLGSLGHFVVPEDQLVGIDGVQPFANDALLMHPDAWSLWSSNNSFKVPKAFLESPEADRFRAALAGLDLEKLLSKPTEDDGLFREWPSRTFWRTLWEENGPLQEYLDAYTALVAAARQTYEPAAIFWATYPMSASIWRTKHSGGCRAVLLSPLHPLRLAWLAGVEQVLHDAQNALELAGTVEGWNLPLVGPRETNNGRLIAVPIDSGEDQIFLGWSMMVAASIDGFEALSSPQSAGGFPVPGSAVSGLNGPAAAAALRSYRSMNPQLSTLTVDLAAATKTRRLADVDEAVLSAVQEWTGGSGAGLMGGARVWDSLFRQGRAPRNEVTKLVRDNPDLLLTWSRYEPDALKTRVCNVRFLQDAGTKIEISNSPYRHGSMGPVPLRRFEGYIPPVDGADTSFSNPAVDHGGGWQPFIDALNAVEVSGPAPRIASKLFNSLLVDDRADWTVSGESMLSPSAIATLIKESTNGSQMLWEWRPPYLDKNNSVPLMERRPFVSIARVPSSFEAQLGKLLEKAQTGRVQKEQVQDLIAKLGSRGVGLSALLSMGGTHVAGAIGFYLAFSMFDGAHSGDVDQFVIPIDAADTFLRLLSGQDKHGRHNRRADLLLVRIDENGVVLVPVEVKCYGLQVDVPSGSLPEPGSHALNESLEQLDSTYKLLVQLANEARRVTSESPSDALLWMNALATLLETGARLQPASSRQPERLARRLGALTAGELPIRVGKPLVAYFKHLGPAASEARYAVHRSSAQPDEYEFEQYGALIADTRAAFDEIELPDSRLVSEWAETVDWALTGDTTSLLDPENARAHEDSQDTQSQLGNKVAERTASGHKKAETTDTYDVGAEVDKESSDKTADHPKPLESESVHNRPAGILDEGIRFDVGSTIGTLAPVPTDFWPSNTRLNQMNLGVVGDLGTGKTELLKALVAQLRTHAKTNQSEPLNFLILDYKGDFQGEEFLQRVGGKVIDPYEIPLNIFAPVTSEHARQPYQQAAAFVDILKRIYSGVGFVQSENLNQVIRELFDESGGEPPLLAEVRGRYEALVGKPDSVMAILNAFVYGNIFSSNRDELMSFKDMIHDKVLVVALDKLGMDQQAKNALVALFLNVYYDYMIRSEKPPFQGKDPQLRYLKSFLLVDEAVNIMAYEFPVLMNLMLLGRQYGFGVMLSSQYLSHYKQGGLNYGQPLLTWFIHKVPSVSVKELEQLGLPGLGMEVASRIPTLNQHEALYKSLGSESGRFIKVHPYYEIYG